ncbi:MAG TPA: hypothetical protein VKI40_05905, partial [Terriglobales bacterium]|nr:hypothetical protein [Terriglobales bacterium]
MEQLLVSFPASLVVILSEAKDLVHGEFKYIGPSLRSKFVTFFVGLIVAQSYKGSMSHREEEATGEAQEAQAAVRLR